MPSRLVEAILGTGDTDISGDEFLSPKPYIISHGNGVTQEFTPDGDEIWRKAGQLHRDGDKPAVIYPDGGQFWYKNGRIHRDGDKPAFIHPDGTKAWYQNGKLHRDGNKPADIHPDGSVEYWVNGQRLQGVK